MAGVIATPDKTAYLCRMKFTCPLCMREAFVEHLKTQKKMPKNVKLSKYCHLTCNSEDHPHMFDQPDKPVGATMTTPTHAMCTASDADIQPFEIPVIPSSSSRMRIQVGKRKYEYTDDA